MKKFFLLAAASALLAANASALSLTVNVGDPYFVGSFDPGNEDPQGEVDAINVLTTIPATISFPGYDVLGDTIGAKAYERSGLVGPFTPALLAGAIKDDTTKEGEPGYGTLDVTGFLYVLAKYGNASSLVWYNAAGFSGMVDVPLDNPFATVGGGLSHISAYNPGTRVPDGGLTAALIGAALLVIGLFSRRRA